MFPFFINLGRRVLALLWATLALAGCVAPPRVVMAPAQAPAARVAIVNLTPHAWRIAWVAAAGGVPRVVQVDRSATVELELAGGDYQVEQVLLTDPGTRETARRFPATFTAGQTYRWPLATLGADADGGDR